MHPKQEQKKAASIYVSTVSKWFSSRSRRSTAIVSGGSAAGYHDGQHQGHDDQQQQQQNSEQLQVTVEPSEVAVSRGEEATVTCNVKGAERYTVKWGKYAHDTSLPDYVRVSLSSKGAPTRRLIPLRLFSNKEIVSSSLPLEIHLPNRRTSNVKLMFRVKPSPLMVTSQSIFVVEMSRVRS